MPVSDQALDEAVVWSLTHTKTGAPEVDEPLFFEHYGDQAQNLLAALDSLLQETMAIQVDWNGKSLVEGGTFVKSVLRDRHPWLSDTALGLLGGYFTFRWR